MQALHQLNIRTPDASCEDDRTKLVIAGATGRVGSALCRQIAALGTRAPHVIGVANSRRTILSPGGVSADALAGAGQATEWSTALMRLGEDDVQGLIFVDCTASAEVASLYPEILERGFGIATANKIASSSPLPEWRRIRTIAESRGVPFLHETTVGAALPLLRTVRDLVATGDEVIELRAVLSGTLSFILGRLQNGALFSEAVGESIDLGYTEPDPTIDLGGIDVARKLVILLREAGVEIDLGEIELDPLVPRTARYTNREAFVAAARDADGSWQRRIAEVRVRDERLVFAATYRDGIARAGLTAVPNNHALASLRPGENALILRTRRYDSVPLTIAGPGAGPEVTAGGLLAEILSAGEAPDGSISNGPTASRATSARTGARSLGGR